MRVLTLRELAAAAALSAACLGPATAGSLHPNGTVPIPERIRLQAAGLIPAPVPASAMQRLVGAVESRPRLHVHFDRNATLGLWLQDGGYGSFLGLTANGKKIVTAISETSNGCFFSNGIKVDHARNLWAACEYNASFSNGVIQEYAPGGSAPSATYNDSGSCGSGCTFAGYPTDVAVDGSGHVFAANIGAQACIGSQCNYNGNVAWWNANSPSSPATIIYDPNMTAVYFLDVDRAGNVYVDGQECIASNCGFGVDEISTPTTAPAFTNLIPPGAITFGGGVYVNTMERRSTSPIRRRARSRSTRSRSGRLAACSARR